MLIVVDPQIDFISGSLPVPGAAEAMNQLADYVKANGDDGYDHTYDVVSSISVSADGSILTIVLADGTVITLPCA